MPGLAIAAASLVSAAAGAGTADAPADDRLYRLLARSSSFTIRYFDPARERRTMRAVGDIDLSFDIETSITCNGADCAGSLRRVPAMFRAAARQAERCSRTRYARIELRGAGGRRLLYLDHSGRCLSTGEEQFMLNEHLLWALRNIPVGAW